MKTKLLTIILSSLVSTVSVLGQGTVLWDESVNGLLSEDFHSPTSLAPLQAGSNSLFGVSELVPAPPNWAAHPNYFTIQVPSGLAVQSIYVQVDKPNVWAWIGNTGFSSDLAYVLNTTSGELLAQWGIGSISTGSYGIYLANLDQQADTSIASFHLDFFVQTVPEPSTLSLLLAGAGFVGFYNWRKSLLRRK